MKKQHLSRRNFLGTACAALSAPLIVPARALGREGAVAPSERIAMGFIGLGGQGSGHLFGGSWTYVAGGYLGRREVQVQAVCDVWKQRREDAADRVNRHYAHTTGQTSYDGCRAYLDFRELLAREDIDAVLMALPFHWHAPMAILAARAGKDVYSEKPVALTIEEGRLLSNTMRRYARVYQAGTQQRSEAEYGGKFQRAWELIRNGYIGELREIYSFSPGGGFSANMQNTRLKEQPLPEGFDWNLYLGTAPWQPFTGGNVHCGIFAYGDPNWGPTTSMWCSGFLNINSTDRKRSIMKKTMLFCCIPADSKCIAVPTLKLRSAQQGAPVLSAPKAHSPSTGKGSWHHPEILWISPFALRKYTPTKARSMPAIFLTASGRGNAPYVMRKQRTAP